MLIRMPVSIMATKVASGSLRQRENEVGRSVWRAVEILARIIGRRNLETAWSERTWRALEIKIHTARRDIISMSSVFVLVLKIN
jgi:hypothetical protein